MTTGEEVRIKWVRTERLLGKNKIPTGESIYTSGCGRFVIHQQKEGSRVWYLLDVDGKPAPRNTREHDLLAAAKFAVLLSVTTAT